MGCGSVTLTAAGATVMEAMVDAAPDGLLLVDGGGRMLVVNRQIEALFGYRRDELIGEPVEMLMPEDVRTVHRQHRARFAAHPASRPMGTGLVLLGRRRDGTEFPVEISLSPLETPDGPRTVATVRDITLRIADEGRIRGLERDLAVGDDRQRIARDLHDRIIQRLFATGLAAQSLHGRIADPVLRERLQQVVADLDATILDLRSAIFELTAHGPATSLRTQVLQVCADARPALGFAPRVRFLGPVETTDPSVGAELVIVLREALSNVGRHARATHVEITVLMEEDLRLLVEDDGVGLPDKAQRNEGNGLDNMTARARNLGGTFEVATGEAGGARLAWQVPLP